MSGTQSRRDCSLPLHCAQKHSIFGDSPQRCENSALQPHDNSSHPRCPTDHGWNPESNHEVIPAGQPRRQFHPSDDTKCTNGDTDLGPNQVLLEDNFVMNLRKRKMQNQDCGHTPGRAFTPCCVFQVPEVLTSGSWNSGLELDDVVFQITITAT